jgi:hypothetical protein
MIMTEFNESAKGVRKVGMATLHQQKFIKLNQQVHKIVHLHPVAHRYFTCTAILLTNNFNT